MKTNLLFLSALFLSVIASCGKIKKTDAEVERDNWIAGFNDSIAYYQDLTKKVESRLDQTNQEIAGILPEFEKVNNPREVTGYYLLNGWKDKLPLTSTGIYARINENEKLELIATLSGATFNRIKVGDDLMSEVVPHDQAFNFRHERFNTVYFTGGKADTIAEYISSHYQDKVNLQFIEGNKTKNFNIPDNEKIMIHKTWLLYSSQMEARDLQRQLWISSRKIDTFRRLMDSHQQQ